MPATLPILVFLIACCVIYGTALAVFTMTPYGIQHAAALAGLPPATRNRVTTFWAGLLILWFLYAWNCLAPQMFGNILPVSFPIRALTSFLIPVVVGSLLLFTLPVLRSINRTMPSHWPVAIQTFRLIGAIFLLYQSFGSLPAEFALWAGWGDILVGVLAPFVAWNLKKRGRYAIPLAIAWNWLGIADFVSAIVHAIHSGARLDYPIGIIPGYFVPLCILVHLFSLRNLALQGRGNPAGS
ncbi:MAG TPA: hypothetical protein VKU00_07665 [Chthonomonadaceae bacterium]|nr:hypothetical protein [Chthonomonadaceae bacterium]